MVMSESIDNVKKGCVTKLTNRKRTFLLLLVITMMCGTLFVHKYSDELHAYDATGLDVADTEINCQGSITRVPRVYTHSGDATSLDEEDTEINCQGSITRVPQVHTHSGEGWRRNKTICDKCFNFPKVTFRTNFGNTPIFIYNERADDWVSRNLKKYGMYDPSKQNVIYSLLKIDPELNLIDIGANIGKV